MLEKIKQNIKNIVKKNIKIIATVSVVVILMIAFTMIYNRYPLKIYYKIVYGLDIKEPNKTEIIYSAGEISQDYYNEYFKIYYSDYEYERMINNRIFQEMDKTIVNEILDKMLEDFPTFLPFNRDDLMNEDNYYSYHEVTSSKFFEGSLLGGILEKNLMILDKKNKVIHVLVF